jgi:2-succinyl-5-enolpyruvyl-6-hydroxy-3-cyclohexene-1-carboxylate synthase
VNPSTALGRVLVDELVRCGVTDVVLAPGSRSAPLAFALHDADAAGRLRLHVRIDERSAGFLALGLARTAGMAAVVTTSGTAVANLHPAVIEADHAGVPLLVCSADRPADMRGVGANQTIDQVGIFGASARYFHEIGAPDHRVGQVAYWRSTVSRAVLAARGGVGGDPGPVHLNVGLREPLVPDGDDVWVESLEGRSDGHPWIVVAEPDVTSRDAAPAFEAPLESQNILMIIGDAPADVTRMAGAVAMRAGWPVIAEPMARSSVGDAVTCGPLVAGVEEWVDRHRPDRILVIGRPTLSRPVNRLLGGSVAPVDVVAPTSPWADPGHAVRTVYPAAALPALGDATGDPAFAAAWQDAGRRARDAVAEVLDSAPICGLTAVRAIVDALPTESLLYLGSSSVIRDIDLVGGALPSDVHANRGAAGIDGTVSSAVGAALGRPGQPAYAVVGDLTFLHDANGLVIGPDEPRPDLCIVVVNDNGGGIFGLLEQGAREHAGAFERIFGTPHHTDLGSLCAATGTPFERVKPDEVALALSPRAGVRVVEIPVGRDGHRDVHGQLRAAVADALM